jgi:hypothetical protein
VTSLPAQALWHSAGPGPSRPCDDGYEEADDNGPVLLQTATALYRVGDHTFAWDVPDGWQQGRGAWGGLVAAGVARAVELSERSSERSLRTLSLHLPAPLPVGRVTVRVAPLRVGSGLSTWTVSVHDAGEAVCAHAVVLTGRSRVPDLSADARSWPTAQPPTIPAWTEVAALPSGLPGMPVFLQHLEVRPVQGLPLQGGQSRCLGYVRLADQGAWDVRHLLAVVDAWWPTVLTVLPSMRPLATVTYAAHVLVDPSTIAAGEPLVYEASMAGTEGGFTTETRRLWTLDGRLAVENHQSIVVIA